MKREIWILNHYAGSMFFNRGGRHYSIAKYLRRMGYSPTVFACNSKHNSQSENFFNENALWSVHSAEEIDVPFVFVKGRAYTGNGKQRILNMIDFYRNVKVVAKEYTKRHGKPDIIYASSVHPLTVVAGIQLAKYYSVPCICEIRDLWPESLVAYGIAGPHNPAVLLLRRLEKWIYKKSDAIVFTMEGAYDYIVEQGWEKDVPRSKVHFINNGVDLEVFDYNKEHFRLEDPDLEDPNIFKVVYAGSIRKVNNVGRLLDAAKQIKDPRARFLIWGAGDERQVLEKRIVEEKISNVTFKGAVGKKYVPYIASCSNLNFLDICNERVTRFGISSNKLFEYFAAGHPILLARMKCFPMDDSLCKISYDTCPESIAAGIQKAMAMSEEDYNIACSEARQAAYAYDFKTLTEKLVKVLDKEIQNN